DDATNRDRRDARASVASCRAVAFFSSSRRPPTERALALPLEPHLPGRPRRADHVVGRGEDLRRDRARAGRLLADEGHEVVAAAPRARTRPRPDPRSTITRSKLAARKAPFRTPTRTAARSAGAMNPITRTAAATSSGTGGRGAAPARRASPSWSPSASRVAPS